MTLFFKHLTIFIAASILVAEVASLKNVKVERTSDLMEQGSNLLVFRNKITYEADGNEK